MTRVNNQKLLQAINKREYSVSLGDDKLIDNSKNLESRRSYGKNKNRSES